MAPRVTLSQAFFAILLCSLGIRMAAFYPVHASCVIRWNFKLDCGKVNQTLTKQINAWTGGENCAHGGEKCFYSLTGFENGELKATHETPKKHYVDDLVFSFTADNSFCNVTGKSSSEVWYAFLDYGTNYCNLHNLITGSGLNTTKGYSEYTSNLICTQFTSANCDKY